MSAKPLKFKPSTNRGAALAREVLDAIEYEHAQAEKLDLDRWDEDLTKEGTAWNQGIWFEAHPENFAADTKAKVVEKSDCQATVALEPRITCGTAMCFAGHATNMVGDRFLITLLPEAREKIGNVAPGGDRKFSKIYEALNSDTDVEVYITDMVVTRNGRRKSIEERARELLGLSWEDAGILFYGDNLIEDLRFYVDLLEKHGKIKGTAEHRERHPERYMTDD